MPTPATKTAARKTTARKSPARKTSANTSASAGFSADERAAMRARAKELKAEAKANLDRAAGEAELKAQINAMPAADRTLATRLHALVAEHAPDLQPKTWYGMPAWARDGKVVVFFQAASKFKARYATLGFNGAAALDDGAMWPTAYALTALGDAEAKAIARLLRKAVG